VQAKLTSAITTALKARLSPQERALIATRPTANADAYELYQRARQLEDIGNPRESAPYIEAIELYERAVGLDPKFAQAYAKLSAAHGLLYWFTHWDPTPARREKAKAALDAAERLAPDAPETMMARGVYAYRCENDYERALAQRLGTPGVYCGHAAPTRTLNGGCHPIPSCRSPESPLALGDRRVSSGALHCAAVR
jgi:tetratricopeptide (TPR) repeat protein